MSNTNKDDEVKTYLATHSNCCDAMISNDRCSNCGENCVSQMEDYPQDKIDGTDYNGDKRSTNN